jgi:hypothetical protein
VAVAHTQRAVETIFAPFVMYYRSQEGSIGGGHDAYILQKPFDAPPIVAGPYETVTEVTGDPKPVQFVLDINGQNTFRTFAASRDPGVFLTCVSASVTAELDGKVFHHSETRLSRGATYFFGNHQYTPIDIKLPANAKGQLRVTITPKAPGQHYLTHLRCLAPHVFNIQAPLQAVPAAHGVEGFQA